jgi:hypothetical protein
MVRSAHLSAYLMSINNEHILTKFGFRGLHCKLSVEFIVGLYRSSVTHIYINLTSNSVYFLKNGSKI